jgi:hypothetical protein
MTRKGVEFTLFLIEPDLWKWRFQIGETATTGKTRTKLMGLLAELNCGLTARSAN